MATGPTVPTEVILSGGNFATMAFFGSIQALVDKEEMDISQVKRWVGTSGGAVVAFLLSLGYEPQGIFNVIRQIPLDKISHVTSDKWLSFFDNYGLHDTGRFRGIFATMMTHLGWSPDTDFQTFYEQTETELVFTSYCLNSSSVVLLNHTTTPDLKVLDGLCMSIAVPFLFYPVSYQNRLYVDAFTVSNIPVEFCSDCESICICLEHPIHYHEKIDILTFLRIVIQAPVSKLEGINLDNYTGRIVKIVSDYDFGASFDISTTILDNFYNCGYNAVVGEDSDAEGGDTSDAEGGDTSDAEGGDTSDAEGGEETEEKESSDSE